MTSTPTTVRFRVGGDRDVIETVLFLDADATTDDVRRKLAARGLTSPNQFPASAVHLVTVTPPLTPTWETYRGVSVERIFPSGMHRIHVQPSPIITDGDPRELVNEIRAGKYDGEHYVPDADEYADTVTPDAADFLANRTHYDGDHVASVAALREADGTPYCRECHDWHHADEAHSTIG